MSVPAAIWGIDIATGALAPYSTVVGALQYGDRYVITPLYSTLQSVTVHDRETEESWGLIGIGSLAFISPDGTRIAYDGRMAQERLYANRRQALDRRGGFGRQQPAPSWPRSLAAASWTGLRMGHAC